MPGRDRCSRTSGLVSTGKSMTKVGLTSEPFTKCSHSSSTYLPGSGWSISMSTLSASFFSSAIGVCGVISTPAAALSESYMLRRSHSPPRSYSVPSAQVTTCEPDTATAAFWIISCVRSAIWWSSP